MGAIIKNCCERDSPKLPPPVVEQKHHVVVSSPPRAGNIANMSH